MTIKAGQGRLPEAHKTPGKEVGINHFLPPLKKGFQVVPNCRIEGSRVGVGVTPSEGPTPGQGLCRGRRPLPEGPHE